VNNTRSNIPNLIIANSGSQRFDIYAGPFTKNDQLTVSPFNDAFLFIPNVTFSVASQVLPTLNHAGANQRRAVMEELEARELELYGRGYVDMVYRKWLEEMDVRNNGFEKRAAQNLTLGYVTADVCFKFSFCDGSGQVLISTIPSVMPWNWRRYPPRSPPVQQGSRFHRVDPTTGVHRCAYRSRLCRFYRDPAIADPQLDSDDEELHHSGCANLQPTFDQSGVRGVCSEGMELRVLR